MRIPLAPAGSREMIIITVAFGSPAVAAYTLAATGHAWLLPIGILLTVAWAGGVAFFRDPQRTTPAEPGILVAPADGKIVETAKLDHHDEIGGPATRISIFLSVFDVHVNRSPCAGVIRAITYTPGQFLDARDPNSGSKNEANTLVIEPDDPNEGFVVVRQIAGLIARRIVCSVKVGDRVQRGQRIGLIKFGSRTELILTGHDHYVPAVEIGDRAKGAMTILARRVSEPVHDNQPASTMSH